MVSVAAGEPIWKDVSPRGLSQGDTVEFTVSGSDLDNATRLHFRDGGLSAEKVGANKFKVTAGADTRLGRHWVWLETSVSLLGPQAIYVSSIPRVARTQPSDTVDSAMTVSLPCIVDGQIDGAADVHWFRFSVDAPTSLTVVANTTSLGSGARLAMTLVDGNGRELRHSDGRSDEPLLHYRAEIGDYLLRVVERSYTKPARGFYRVQFRVGPVVRTVFPHVTRPEADDVFQVYGYALPGISDASGGPETDANCLLAHPTATSDVDDPKSRMSVAGPMWPRWLDQTVSLKAGEAAGAILIETNLEFDPRAVKENAAQDEGLDGAQKLDVPARVIGQLERRADVDWYQFTAKKGESFALAARGERLGQRMDLSVAIHDADGRQLLDLPDSTQPKGAPPEWNWVSLDPSGVWKAPADGAFYIAVRDLYGGSVFGTHRVYELLLQRAEPGFVIAALLPSKNGPTGVLGTANSELKVPLALHRQRGFTGNVSVKAVEPLLGIDVRPLELDAKQSAPNLIISIIEDAPAGLYELKLEASAEIDGQQRQQPVIVPLSLRPDGAQQSQLPFLPLVVRVKGGDGE